jgi:hypothetical protein
MSLRPKHTDNFTTKGAKIYTRCTMNAAEGGSSQSFVSFQRKDFNHFCFVFLVKNLVSLVVKIFKISIPNTCVLKNFVGLK